MPFLLKILSLLALLALPLISLAGERGGNGGDGIMIEGKLYVLDLVESGVEKEPYFDPSVTGEDDVVGKLNKIFYRGNVPVALVAQKLAELKQFSPLLSETMVKTAELFNWKFVNSSLIDIKDEYSVLDYKEIKQLAIRKGTSIFINRDLWAQLDIQNQTALIFHEILYALITPKEISKGIFRQHSDRVREVVGALFSTYLKVNGTVGLDRLLGDDFMSDVIGVTTEETHVFLEKDGNNIYQSPKIELGYFDPKTFIGDKFDAFHIDSDRSDDEYLWHPKIRAGLALQKVCSQPAGTNVRIGPRAANMEILISDYQDSDAIRSYAKVHERSQGTPFLGSHDIAYSITTQAACEIDVKRMVMEQVDYVRKLFKMN